MPTIFQDMLSCVVYDISVTELRGVIFAEEQKLISLLCLYVKAATLRLELFEEWAKKDVYESLVIAMTFQYHTSMCAMWKYKINCDFPSDSFHMHTWLGGVKIR